MAIPLRPIVANELGRRRTEFDGIFDGIYLFLFYKYKLFQILI